MDFSLPGTKVQRNEKAWIHPHCLRSLGRPASLTFHSLTGRSAPQTFVDSFYFQGSYGITYFGLGLRLMLLVRARFGLVKYNNNNNQDNVYGAVCKGVTMPTNIFVV